MMDSINIFSFHPDTSSFQFSERSLLSNTRRRMSWKFKILLRKFCPHSTYHYFVRLHTQRIFNLSSAKRTHKNWLFLQYLQYLQYLHCPSVIQKYKEAWENILVITTATSAVNMIAYRWVRTESEESMKSTFLTEDAVWKN